MTRAPLRSVCTQYREQIPSGQRADLKYVGLESIEPGTGELVQGDLSKTPADPRAVSFRFDTQHVLYGKLRPYLNKVLTPGFEGKCSTELIPLLPGEALDRRYLAYFLRNPATVRVIAGRTAGARMPRTDMNFLLGLEIPLPSLPEQHRIVDLLSRAEGIVRLRREAQRRAAELLPALFLDMFGDPANNSRGWPVVELGDLAEVQGGLQVTKKRVDLPIERSYLRVANVYRGYLDLSELKTIRVTEAEFRRTKLELGDLLFVEGHGNAGEVGRCAVWDGSVEECTHQNHLIRARLDASRILPSYACMLFNSKGGREALIRAGKTTSGLSTISVKNVKDAATMLPPVKLQRQFADKADAVLSILAQQKAALGKTQAAFDGLSHQAFSR